jgi:hypothetical protein
MSDVPAAVGFDRLPWLADDHPPPAARQARRREARPPRGGKLYLREWLGWAVAALLMIAGASYWLGIRTAGNLPVSADPERLSPPVTVPLPGPRAAPQTQSPQAQLPQAEAPQIVLEPTPQVEPVAAPPPAAKTEAAPKPRSASAQAKRKSSPRASAKSAAPALWPVRAEAGASGRLVRIGTFSTRRQAKRGWARIMRFYPGMSRLPALVVAQPSLRDGRTYYRLQMGTTSQAHSEVLCQRMRIIAQSCVVVDVPGESRNSGARR